MCFEPAQGAGTSGYVNIAWFMAASVALYCLYSLHTAAHKGHPEAGSHPGAGINCMDELQPFVTQRMPSSYDADISNHASTHDSSHVSSNIGDDSQAKEGDEHLAGVSFKEVFNAPTNKRLMAADAVSNLDREGPLSASRF